MKKITILSILLCISCLTGCQKMEAEIGETVLQAANITESGNQEDCESENQENIELGEVNIDLDYGIDSIEKIHEYMIPEQSFDITLDDWGEVTFVSCRPFYGTEFEYASFYLVRDDQILYKFPYLYENNNTMGHQGLFDCVDSVGFRDINNDGQDDMIVITHYFYAGYYSYMTPRTEVRIFLAGENEFYIADDMATDAAKHITEKDITIDRICQYISSKNTENDEIEIYETWQDAYKNILCNIEDNLLDSFRFNSEWNSDTYVDESHVYIALHDFDNDDIPELIIGDAISVAVFTYEEGKIKKVATLYETMEWGD